MPKTKKIVINKEANDILEKHFGGEISLIKGSKLTKLYDEGLLSNQMMKFLKVVKQTHNKSEKGEIELKITYELDEPKKDKEPTKIIIDDALHTIIQEHFDSKIESIKGSTLQTLLKKDEITKDQMKLLISLKKISKKDNFKDLIEYDLKEEKEEKEVKEEKEDKDDKDDAEKAIKKLLPQTPMEFIKNKDKNKERFNEFEEQYFLSLTPTDEELRLFKLIQEAKDLDGNPLDKEQKVSSNLMTADEWNEILRKDSDENLEKEDVVKPIDIPELEPEPGPVIIDPDEIKESKYVIQHRKAFVNYINQGFYKQILKETSEQTGDKQLNVYQVLVKEYLSIESPYRGLLVYHGLGTGKTATAVSMAEKISSDMKLTTLLPASLENNFIDEIKKWGKDELDLYGSHWTFVPFSEIEDTAKIRKDLLKQYGITSDNIREIIYHTIRIVKKRISLQ